MSPEDVFFLNYGLHSLAFGFLGWLILRCLIRDALRRSVTAMMAILFSVGGPWLVSSLPPINEGRGTPALATLHQTLDTDWRIAIRPETSPAASPEMATPYVSKFVWHADHWMVCLKWVLWSGVAALLLRHLWQTGRILVWRRGLRKLAQEELESIPQALRGKPLAIFHHPGTPCVVGWFRPLIAVPASSFATLTARQWHWLVRHEEEHCAEETRWFPGSSSVRALSCGGTPSFMRSSSVMPGPGKKSAMRLRWVRQAKTKTMPNFCLVGSGPMPPWQASCRWLNHGLPSGCGDG